MDRRQMLGILGASATGLAAVGTKAVAAPRPDHDDEHKHSEGQDAHLALMNKCANICNEAAHHCLVQLKTSDSSGEHHAKSHTAAIDCQAFCTLTAALMARHSPMSKYAHAACADACRDCAAACEGHAAADKIMAECVQVCRECEKACRKMVGAHDHDHDHNHEESRSPKKG